MLGTVTSKDVPANPRMDETIYNINVEKVFEGSITANQQLTIHSNPINGYGNQLKAGVKYLIEGKARYLLQLRIENFASEYSIVTSLSHKK